MSPILNLFYLMLQRFKKLNKIYLKYAIFISKKPSYNSEKISLKQCSDMFN